MGATADRELLVLLVLSSLSLLGTALAVIRLLRDGPRRIANRHRGSGKLPRR
jgi:hypothetical protein